MKRQIRSIIKRTPVISSVARHIYKFFSQASIPFENSGQYWETRYKVKGDSGDGSYGRLAAFKAEVLNNFVSENSITYLVEFGCGDGAQLTRMRYPDYTGIDVSQTILAHCRKTFAGDASKRFYHISDPAVSQINADLALSLDVIYHLIEEQVYISHLQGLFAASKNWVIIYSSDRNDIAELSHVKHRKFTNWIESNQPGWKLHKKIDQRYPYVAGREEDTSFADFYIYKRS